MRKPRFGPTRPKLVSKVRRSSTQAYGSRESWYEITRKVKERDGHKCRKCGSTEYLQVDHIIPVAKGGQTVQQNLWTLCATCHANRPGHKQAKHLILHSKNEANNRLKN